MRSGARPRSAVAAGGGAPPAAQVDAAGKQQRNDDPGIKRPRLKYGGYNRIGDGFFYFKLWSVAHDFK